MVNFEEDKWYILVFMIMLTVVALAFYAAVQHVAFDIPSLKCHNEKVIEARIVPTSFNEDITQRVITASGSYTIYTNTSYPSVVEVCADKNGKLGLKALNNKIYKVY